MLRTFVSVTWVPLRQLAHLFAARLSISASPGTVRQPSIVPARRTVRSRHETVKVCRGCN